MRKKKMNKETNKALDDFAKELKERSYAGPCTKPLCEVCSTILMMHELIDKLLEEAKSKEQTKDLENKWTRMKYPIENVPKEV